VHKLQQLQGDCGGLAGRLHIPYGLELLPGGGGGDVAEQHLRAGAGAPQLPAELFEAWGGCGFFGGGEGSRGGAFVLGWREGGVGGCKARAAEAKAASDACMKRPGCGC